MAFFQKSTVTGFALNMVLSLTFLILCRRPLQNFEAKKLEGLLEHVSAPGPSQNPDSPV